MLEMFDTKNFTPEYLHVIINHIPIEGLIFSLMGVVLGFILKSKETILVSCILISISAFSAYPVYEYGQSGYDRMSAKTDDDGQKWLDEHLKRANKMIYVYYFLGGLALINSFLIFKKSKTYPLMTIAIIIISSAVIFGGTWVAYAGGKVSHPEFRHNKLPDSE